MAEPGPGGERRATGDEMNPDDLEAWPGVYDRLAPPPNGLLSWRTRIPGVEPWSSENPRLYRLTVHLLSPSGEIADEVEFRLGFRRVEVRGRDVDGTRRLERADGVDAARGELAEHILLVGRTSSAGTKHEGLTMLNVPAAIVPVAV